MLNFLLVGAGGALGAMLRYGAGRLLPMGSWPWATFTVNILGGLLMGLLAGWLAARGGSESWRLFLGVGMLGGFTTFSAYSLEVALMVERGQPGLALAYALASMALSVAALFLGLWAMRSLA
jgi:CrcB protein